MGKYNFPNITRVEYGCDRRGPIVTLTLENGAKVEGAMREMLSSAAFCRLAYRQTGRNFDRLPDHLWEQWLRDSAARRVRI
jgi:hypothetical protein